jgi:hypothetical protein
MDSSVPSHGNVRHVKVGFAENGSGKAIRSEFQWKNEKIWT